MAEEAPASEIQNAAETAGDWQSDIPDASPPERLLARETFDLHESPLQSRRDFDLYERLPFRLVADGDFFDFSHADDVAAASATKDATTVATETTSDDDIVVTGIIPPPLGGVGGGTGDGGSGDTIDHQAGFNTGSETDSSGDEACG